MKFLKGSYFNHDSMSLPGFGKYFMESWKEENEHAGKIIEYIILRGGTPGLYNWCFKKNGINVYFFLI